MSSYILDLIDGAVEQHGDAMRWRPDGPDTPASSPYQPDGGVLLAVRLRAGTPDEQLVVTQADREVVFSGELIDSLRFNPLVEVAGDHLTFGTEGWGVGRVTYEVAPFDFQRDLWLMRRVYRLVRMSCVRPILQQLPREMRHKAPRQDVTPP